MSLRQTLLHYETTPSTPEKAVAFVQGAVPPRVLVETLEELVKEGKLTRREATHVEEKVFKQMRGEAWR